jgi:hypothetical protein
MTMSNGPIKTNRSNLQTSDSTQETGQESSTKTSTAVEKSSVPVGSKPKLPQKEKASPNTIPTDHFEKAESPGASSPAGRAELQILKPKSPRQAAIPQGSIHKSIPRVPLDLLKDLAFAGADKPSRKVGHRLNTDTPIDVSSKAVANQGEDVAGASQKAAQKYIDEMKAEGRVELVHPYCQGNDIRQKDLDKTEPGWCLGVSTVWLAHGYGLKYATGPEERVKQTMKRLEDAENVLASLKSGARQMTPKERGEAIKDQEVWITRLKINMRDCKEEMKPERVKRAAGFIQDEIQAEIQDAENISTSLISGAGQMTPEEREEAINDQKHTISSLRGVERG